MGTFYIKQPKELAYIHVPRTGLAMKAIIREWLKPRFGVVDDESWMIDHPNLSMVREKIPRAKTMTVVRNPWMRIWSFYKKIRDEGYWLDWNNQSTSDLKPFDEWLEDYENPEIKFEFPRWFNRFTNQIDFITTDSEEVDFVLKCENLVIDFQQIQEYLGCYEPLPDLSIYNRESYQKYYSTKGRDIVARLFSRDIDRWKYDF